VAEKVPKLKCRKIGWRGRARLVCTGCTGILDHALGMDGHRSADPWKKSVGIWIRGGVARDDSK